MKGKENKVVIELNWKKRIKYLQILFFVFLLLGYFVYWWFSAQKNKYIQMQNKLNREIAQLAQKESILTEAENFVSNLKDIKKNFSKFAYAFNNCYLSYEKKWYSLYTWLVSLRNCIYEKWYNKPYIKIMSDDDLVKIAKSFGILTLNNKKLNFPQTQILYSLDKNIFADDLEHKVDFITFWNPTLVNKKFNLYSVSFSFKTKVNYSIFQNLFKKLQNTLFDKNYIYYDIQSISSFDVTEAGYQDLLVQGKIYFQK